MNPRLNWLIRLGVAAALLGYLLWRADLASLWRLLAGQAPTSLIMAAAMVLLATIVGTFKWGLLLPTEAFGRLLRLNLAAGFYSLIVPGQVGAEGIKAYQLGRGRIDAEAIAASVILDKVTGLLALLALGVTGALLSTLHLVQPLWLSLIALLVVGAAVLLGLRIPALRSFVEYVSGRLQRHFPLLERPVRRIMLFVEAWCAYLRRPGLLWASFAAGVLQQAIYIAMVALLSRQLGVALPIFEWCWIFAVASAATVLPITPAGLGVREGIFVGLLSAFGIPAEQALALSLTILALQVLFGLIGGALELLRVAGPR